MWFAKLTLLLLAILLSQAGGMIHEEYHATNNDKAVSGLVFGAVISLILGLIAISI